MANLHDNLKTNMVAIVNEAYYPTKSALSQKFTEPIRAKWFIFLEPEDHERSPQIGFSTLPRSFWRIRSFCVMGEASIENIVSITVP